MNILSLNLKLDIISILTLAVGLISSGVLTSSRGEANSLYDQHRVIDHGYMSRKIRKFRTDKFDT